MKNVNDRLRGYYGEEAYMKIESELGVGTQRYAVSLRLRTCISCFLSTVSVYEGFDVRVIYFVSKNRGLTYFRNSKNSQVACEGVASSGIRA